MSRLRPLAGALITAIIATTVVVAAPSVAHAATLRLVDMNSVDQDWCDSSWSAGSKQLNGNWYSASTFCRLRGSGGDLNGYREWDIGRAYSTLRTTVGIDDFSICEAVTHRFTVFGDGVQLATRDVVYGAPFDLSINVSGVLRLRLAVSAISGETCGAVAVFGTPTVSTGAQAPAARFPAVPLQSWTLPSGDEVDVNWCDSSWSRSTANLNGGLYTDSWRCRIQGSGGDIDGYLEYVTSRKYRSFRATFGIDSGSTHANDRNRIRVYGDGNLLYDATTTIGSPQSANIDIRGVLRLQIYVNGDGDGGDGYNNLAVIGSPVLTPAISAIAMIDGASRLWNNLGYASSGYAPIAGGATKLSTSDNWITMIDSGDQLWIKEDNPVLPWTRIARGAAETLVTDSGRIFMIDNGRNLWVKEGSKAAAWRRIARGVVQVRADGNRIGVVDSSNRAWVAEGAVTAPFTLVASSVREIELSGNRIGILTRSGDFWAKQGTVSAPLTRIARGAVDVAVDGTRLAMVDVSGRLWAKDGDLTSSWLNLSRGGQTNVQLEGDRVMTRDSAGRLYLKVGSLATPFFIVASGSRVYSLN